MDVAARIEQMARTWRFLALGRAEVNYLPDKKKGAGSPRVFFVTSEEQFVEIANDAPATHMVAVGVNPRPAGLHTFAKDADIERIKNLVIDIDPTGDREWDSPVDHEAKARARKFVEEQWLPYCAELGIKPPHIADSGHGWHLLHAIPEVLVAEHASIAGQIKAFVKTAQERFRLRLHELGLKIDNTFDVRRVIKVYGTAKPGGPFSVFGEAIERTEDAAFREHLLSLKPFVEPASTGPVHLAEIKESDIPERFKDLLVTDPHLRGLWDGTVTSAHGDPSYSGKDWHLALRCASRHGIRDAQALAAIILHSPYNVAKGRWAKKRAHGTLAYIKKTVGKVIAKVSAFEVIPSPVAKPPMIPTAGASHAGSPGAAAAASASLADAGESTPAIVGIHYKVVGAWIAKDGLHAHVEAHDREGLVHVDKLPLVSARRRSEFAAAVAEARPGTSADSVKKDLLRVWDSAKRLVEERARPVPSTPPEEDDKDREEARREAEELLEDPNIMDVIGDDMTAMGVEGEDLTKRLLYLVGISRLLVSPARPLAILIQARSASGKSYIPDKVFDLTPPEHRIDATSFSEQALAYAGRNYLSHKLVRIGEVIDTEESKTFNYYVREILSRGVVSRMVTMECDPEENDGRAHTMVEVTAEGPIAFMETTTKMRIDEENATRMFVVRIDESEAHTRAIHKALRVARTKKGIGKALARKRIIKKHHELQRMLESLPVEIPFAEHIDFPTMLRTRRDFSRFLDLISAIALLHQRQRTIKDVDGQRVIVARLSDYEIAHDFATSILADSLSDVPGPAREMYEQLTAAGASGKLPAEFTKRDVATALGTEWTESRIYRGLKELLRHGLVEVFVKSGGPIPDKMKLVKAKLGAKIKLTTPSELARAAVRAALRSVRR